MQINVTFQPSTKDIGTIYQGLMALHEQQFPNLKEQSIACFLRDKTAQVVGGVCGSQLATSLYIQYLWVKPELRGVGQGMALLEQLEQTAKERGVTHLFVDTFAGQAVGFYQKLGFAETGRLRHFPVANSERVYLTKSLTKSLIS